MNFIQILPQAIESADGKLLREAVYDLQGEFMLEGIDSFPEEVFRCLLEVFRKEEFQQMNGSWHALYLFHEDWGLLTRQQQDRLLETLESVYDRFSDWMTPFMITEILGENYCDERALEVLLRLKEVWSETPRSLVPHGFEHLALNCPCEDVANRAFQALLAMRSDSSKQVRQEIAQSLAKVQAKRSRFRQTDET